MLKVLLAIVMALGVSPAWAQGLGSASAEGEVLCLCQEGQWQRLEPGTTVEPGMGFKTQKGVLKIRLLGAEVNLSEGAELYVDDASTLVLRSGTLEFKSTRFLTIKTPGGEFIAPHWEHTKAAIRLRPQGVQITLYSGSLSVRPKTGRPFILKGKKQSFLASM